MLEAANRHGAGVLLIGVKSQLAGYKTSASIDHVMISRCRVSE